MSTGLCEQQGPYDALEPLSIPVEAFEDGLTENRQHAASHLCKRANCPLGCNDPDSELSGEDSSDDEWPTPPVKLPAKAVPLSSSASRDASKNRQNSRTRKLKYSLSKAEKDEDRLDVLRNNLLERNGRLIRKAFVNVTHIKDVSLRDLVARKKAGKPRQWPKKPVEVVWGDSEPHLAVDDDGLPLVVHFPHFLGLKGNKRLYRLLRRFGREMEVKPRRAAKDARKRDNIKAYIYLSRKAYLSGVVQLVSAWTAIGHLEDEAVPSSDVLKTGSAFRTAMGCIRDLAFVSSLIDDMLKKLDPAAYQVLSEGRKLLRRENPAYAAISSLDPTYLHGRSISYNRATPNHEDLRDLPEVLTPLLVVGKFKSGGQLVIERLGLTASYLPGTLLFIRGAVLPHEVKAFQGGQRISIAHFVHKAVLARVGILELPITPYTSSPYFAAPLILSVK